MQNQHRLNILISAYSCEPWMGSEPAVGWSTVEQMSAFHDLCVVTRTSNRDRIERFLAEQPLPGVQFVYYDLPKWLLRLKPKGTAGVQLYYPLWQVAVFQVYRKLSIQRKFDVSIHLTMGKYYIPSMLPLLKIPFLWGVVGAGESMPIDFYRDLSPKEFIYEFGRCVVRGLNELNPLLWINARRARLVMAASEQTAARIRRLGAKNIKVVLQHALSLGEYEKLVSLPENTSGTFRFISIGRATGWKGFHLGLKAFMAARIPDAEYWMLVNGGSRRRLEKLAEKLGIAPQVRFFDPQSSLDAVYDKLSQCDVLIHPALHEAFGMVVLEARAAGKPVVCLDIGGPAQQVDGKNGFKVSAYSRSQVVQDMANAMQRLYDDQGLFREMSDYARIEAGKNGVWDRQVEILSSCYFSACEVGNTDAELKTKV